MGESFQLQWNDGGEWIIQGSGSRVEIANLKMERLSSQLLDPGGWGLIIFDEIGLVLTG